MTPATPELRTVVDAHLLDDTTAIVTFDNGQTRRVDLTAYLALRVFVPIVSAGRVGDMHVDPDTRTLTWPGGVDVCPDVLYADSTPLEDPA